MYYVYSHEAMPNPNLMGKPDYTPEWFVWGGIQLQILKAGEWTTIKDSYSTMVHEHYRDRQGTERFVRGSHFAGALKKQWGERGVIVIDHEPTAVEKAQLEARSKAANLAFRMKIVENFEQERSAAIARQGIRYVMPYEDECYNVLGLIKPYSVEAMRAQRHPGEAVGEQIVQALERLEQRRNQQAAPAPLLPVVEKPKPAATK